MKIISMAYLPACVSIRRSVANPEMPEINISYRYVSSDENTRKHQKMTNQCGVMSMQWGSINVWLQYSSVANIQY